MWKHCDYLCEEQGEQNMTYTHHYPGQPVSQHLIQTAQATPVGPPSMECCEMFVPPVRRGILAFGAEAKRWKPMESIQTNGTNFRYT